MHRDGRRIEVRAGAETTSNLYGCKTGANRRIHLVPTGGAAAVAAPESVGPLFNADPGLDYSSTLAAGSLNFEL